MHGLIVASFILFFCTSFFYRLVKLNLYLFEKKLICIFHFFLIQLKYKKKDLYQAKKLINYDQSSSISYLVRTIIVVGAVILINNNWIFGIINHNMLEINVFNKSIARPCPCLYSQTILSSSKRCRFDCHILHSRLLQIPT